MRTRGVTYFDGDRVGGDAFWREFLTDTHLQMTFGYYYKLHIKENQALKEVLILVLILILVPWSLVIASPELKF